MTKLSGPMLPPRSGGAPQQAVVLLHGYGSNGADLIGLAPHWQDVLPDAVFISPNAPQRCEGLADGFQWFAVDFVGNKLASRQTGCTRARPVLLEFLTDLWAQTGIAPEQTLLVGFSQGAMMALHVGLSLPERLMGIVAFSGAFLPPEGFGQPGLAQPPVCLVHGDADTVVDPERSADADIALRLAGVPVHYHVSPGTGHGIAPDGLEFASQFIARVAAK
ncbi:MULTISPECIES: alpha/beta hydrolase [Devosia]|uniref:alpha/beta hydrolase n=1 Tax=Devosia TaxID=46913 RepID=UPI0027338E58|nr:alpha/beta fold hydrolase [Devosia sp.]MDP2779186.1 prolyl oligopeptidase family serine peptidase [Devosia sp.]HLV82408.1 alpha/beta fold hydrolase [Devosia sp.]